MPHVHYTDSLLLSLSLLCVDIHLMGLGVVLICCALVADAFIGSLPFLLSLTSLLLLDVYGAYVAVDG
jgi:hypothetical protein